MSQSAPQMPSDSDSASSERSDSDRARQKKSRRHSKHKHATHHHKRKSKQHSTPRLDLGTQSEPPKILREKPSSPVPQTPPRKPSFKQLPADFSEFSIIDGLPLASSAESNTSSDSSQQNVNSDVGDDNNSASNSAPILISGQIGHGINAPELSGFTRAAYIYNPNTHKWEPQMDEEIHKAEVEHRRESGIVYDEFTVATLIFSDENLFNPTHCNSGELGVGIHREIDAKISHSAEYNRILEWLKRIKPNVMCFVNVGYEFFAAFIREKWIQRTYHISDDESGRNVNEWRLLVASDMGIDKFEISRLHSSVVTKSGQMQIDERPNPFSAKQPLHARQSPHQSPYRSPTQPTKKKSGSGLTNLNLDDVNESSPQPTKDATKPLTPRASKAQEAMDARKNSQPTPEPAENAKFKDFPDSSSKSDELSIAAQYRSQASKLYHVHKDEYFMLRTFLELGLNSIVVGCMRYSPRFIDRKKQFAQTYKFAAETDIESVLLGKSCEMVYKQPHEYQHAWSALQESDPDAPSLDVTMGGSSSGLLAAAGSGSGSSVGALGNDTQISPFMIPRPLLQWRPSFLSLDADSLYKDLKSEEDQGIFTLMKSRFWKVANIEHFEVKDNTEGVNVVSMADESEAKEEIRDTFGDEVLCRANIVYFVR